MEKAKLNALAVRARDGREETLLDLWNAVKGFVKKKAVYYHYDQPCSTIILHLYSK